MLDVIGAIRGPGVSVIARTRMMSAPRSRNTPSIPLCEAMPASFARMLSNIGPAVRVSS